MKKYSVLCLLMLLASVGPVAFAADAGTDQQDGIVPTEQVGTEDEAAATDNDSAGEPTPEQIASADSNSDESQEQSSARFIPTEQISQDLGVSFPVDI